MTTWQKVLLVASFIATLLVLWLLRLIGVVAYLTGWAPLFVIPITIVAYWKLTDASQRQQFLRVLDQCWLLWVPPTLLALFTTTGIIIASYGGLSVPYFGWGLPGTPWVYVYACNAMLWFVAAFIVALLNQAFSQRFIRIFGTWIHWGGFWKIWSKDNLPANSLLVIYGLTFSMTVLQGYSISDPEMVYQAKSMTAQVVNSELAQTTQAKINRLIGREIFAIGFTEPLIRPEPRYVCWSGWRQATVLLTPFVLVGLVLSRRDGFGSIFLSLAALASRRRDKLSGEGVSKSHKTAEKEAAEGAKEEKKKEEKHDPVAPSFASRFETELLSEVSGRWIYDYLERLLNKIGRWLKRATA